MDEDDHGWRMTINLIAGIVVLLLLGAGLWLADELARARRLDDCLAQGRRNCGPISVPGR